MKPAVKTDEEAEVDIEGDGKLKAKLTSSEAADESTREPSFLRRVLPEDEARAGMKKFPVKHPLMSRYMARAQETHYFRAARPRDSTHGPSVQQLKFRRLQRRPVMELVCRG